MCNKRCQTEVNDDIGRLQLDSGYEGQVALLTELLYLELPSIYTDG